MRELHDRDEGFTLVEVLVSLAIFSLAMLGLGKAATLAVSSTASLQMRTHAGFVADNMVALDRLEPLETGTERRSAESGGIDFDAVIETRQTEQAGFFEIGVEVRQRGEERIWADRRAFRYDAPPMVPQTQNQSDDPPEDEEE